MSRDNEDLDGFQFFVKFLHALLKLAIALLPLIRFLMSFDAVTIPIESSAHMQIVCEAAQASEQWMITPIMVDEKAALVRFVRYGGDEVGESLLSKDDDLTLPACGEADLAVAYVSEFKDEAISLRPYKPHTFVDD